MHGREFPGLIPGEHNHAQPGPAIVGNTQLLFDCFVDSISISSRLFLLPQAALSDPIFIAVASKARVLDNRPPLLRLLSRFLTPLLLLKI